MDNTIVIPTYNRSAYLDTLLLSLSRQSGLDMQTVIVVDDGSTGEHAEVNQKLSRQYGTCYLRHAHTRGPGSTRNSGILATESEWVTFLDDDVWVTNTWYQHLKNSIQSTSEHIVGLEGQTQSEGKGLWDNEVRNISGGTFITANIAYRRSILNTVGLFDERFERYSEDCDLAIRMQRYGSIQFVPQISVVHAPRNIRLLPYFLSSYKRIRQMLDAELLLFMKNRDRYHTCRFRDSFWATYFDIVSRNTVITLRRRKLSSLLKHPRSCFILILSAIMEQICAVMLFPSILHKFMKENSFPDHNICRQKTASLNDLPSETLHRQILKPNIINALFFKKRRQPVYTLKPQPAMSKTYHQTHQNSSPIFLRFDDVFFDNLEIFDAFSEFASTTQIPFVAAIKGQDLASSQLWPKIRQLQKNCVHIGLHGFTHCGKYGPFPSELLQMNIAELDTKLSELFSTVAQNIKTEIFIPPFNAISKEQINHLGSRFRVICGGPETVRFSWRVGYPIVLDSGALYFPSLYPFYQSAKGMLDSKSMDTLLYSRFPVCLTFHMPCEAADNFRAVLEIVKTIRPRICRWNLLWD
ncbi:MAG: glycosyltransferase [Chitinispirillaceae bacterium]